MGKLELELSLGSTTSSRPTSFTRGFHCKDSELDWSNRA